MSGPVGEMSKEKVKKREVRFIVPEEFYVLVKKYADRRFECVGPFVRGILSDCINSLEAEESRKSWRKPNDLHN